ncbi:hypothetical protein JHK85_034408 [Glycine max]|nr:hypothetical protein JHK85_034408 [Glycine max]
MDSGQVKNYTCESGVGVSVSRVQSAVAKDDGTVTKQVAGGWRCWTFWKNGEGKTGMGISSVPGIMFTGTMRIAEAFLNEIKSVLVSALASHGQLSEALLVYEEIKKAGHNLRPKAEELTKFNGELDGLLLLLEEISDLDYWVDGCFKVFSLIAVSEFTHLQIGLDLLWAIKDELGLMASRQCLDFLLSACANAGDLNNARLIWREYEVAGFPYNDVSGTLGSRR